jgi:hypothetical protein
MAAMCSHVPNKGEQMARYYGYYSNVSRGRRKDEDKAVPSILKSEGSSREHRKNCSRLIQKINILSEELPFLPYKTARPNA